MPEPGKSDRWNSLLETLGVPASEIKPETPADAPSAAESPAFEAPAAPKPQPVSMLRPEKPKAAPKPPPAKPAAKSPSYWSRIAGALGLEAPAVPETPIEESLRVPTEEAATQEPVPARPPREEPRRERMEERRPRRTEESPPRETPSRESRRHEPSRDPEPREFDALESELPTRAFQRPPREERPSTREDRSRREERPLRDERPRHFAPPPPPSLNEMFGPKTPDMDVFGLTEEEANAPRGRESSMPRGREPDESGSVLEYDQPASSGSDLSLGAQSCEPGAPAEEESDRDMPRRRRRRRGRGRRGSGESRPAGEAREGAPPRHEADIEPAGEDTDFDFERDEELDLGAQVGRAPDANRDRPEPRPRRAAPANTNRDAESDRYPPAADRAPRGPAGERDERDERGGRSRRGRGRGGNRDLDEASADRPLPYGASPDESERFGPPRDKRPTSARPASTRPVHAADDEADDDFHTDVDDADEGQSGDVPTHRKIPTWDEAVGILIEANMASRTNNPDRNRGRGRGRGR